jgi:HIP---CoA ligase
MSTIPQLFAESVAAYGGKDAISDGETTLSYTQLEVLVHQAARALIASDVSHGDRIAIWAPNMHEWIVAALAVHSVGAILVPINTRYKGPEAAFILKKSECRMLLTVTDFLDTNYVSLLRSTPAKELEGLQEVEIVVLRGEASDSSVTWGDFLNRSSKASQESVRARAEGVSADDLCDIMFTSGTTGEPKGVMTGHGQTTRVFREWARIVALRPEDRYLVVVPFFHSFGYKAGWLAALISGACVFPHAVFDAKAVLKRIEPDRITVVPGPPALYQTMLAQEDLDNYDLSSLRLAVTGAAVIPVSLIDKMRTRLCFDTVITGYGLTESTGVVTMCRDGDPLETIANTSGRAIDNVEVRLIDAEGNTCAAGQAGEVLVRGYNVMRGYWDEPAQTSETVDAEGWLYTGDIGVMTDEGYLKITDRKKDMFIVGGFNAYPAEIENLLLKHEALCQAAVIGVPDARLGEVGEAFVVLAPKASVSEDELHDYCRTMMANFKVPRRFHIVDALPMNASGKVQKFVLRARARPE